MAAITWRNIDAPSLGDASRMLLAGQQGVSQGFQGLGDILKAYTDNQAKNWDVTKANNTEDIYARVASQFRTPEAFKAALASGQIDQMVAATGGQVDRAGVRQYLDSRMGKLITDTTAQRAYEDQTVQREVLPMLQEAKVRAANGDKAGVLDLLKANPNLAKFYGGELAAAGVMGERQLAEFGWKGQEAGRQAERFPVDMEHLRTQMKTSVMNAGSQRISANASAAQASAHLQDVNLRAFKAQVERLNSLQEARSKINTTLASNEGMKLVLDELVKSVPDKGSLAKLQATLGEIVSDPEFRNVTPAAALQALVGDVSTGNKLRKVLWDGSGDSAKSKLRDVMNSDDYKMQQAASQRRMGELNVQIDSLKRALYPDAGSPAAAPVSGSGVVAGAAPVAPVASAAASGAVKALETAAKALPGSGGKVDVGQLETQLQKEQREILAFDERGLPKRTAFSPEVEAYRQAKSSLAAVPDSDKKALATEFARALQKSRDQLPGAEKKSPGITDSATAAQAKTPLIPEPAKVKESVGLSLSTSGSGTVVKQAEPVVIPKDVKWGEKQTVVEAKPAAQIKNTGQKMVLSFVQDGDTATFKNGSGGQVNCRIDKIEAPEVKHTKYNKPYDQPYGQESKRTLQDLVANKEVTINVVKSNDGRNRSICQIEVEGKDVGLEMIRQGAAWAYMEFGRPYSQDAKKVEAESKAAKRGLFADPNAVNPRDFKYPK